MKKVILCCIIGLSSHFLGTAASASEGMVKPLEALNGTTAPEIKKPFRIQSYHQEFYTTCCQQQIMCGSLFITYNDVDGSIWSISYINVCDQPGLCHEFCGPYEI